MCEEERRRILLSLLGRALGQKTRQRRLSDLIVSLYFRVALLGDHVRAIY